MCQWNTGSKFLIDSCYIQIWKDIFRKTSLIHACIHSWMLGLSCHIHPKIFGETQKNTTTDSQISFPSTRTERQENKTELGAERSHRSLMCSPEYRSQSSVSGILHLCKAQADGWEKKFNFGRSTLSMGDMKWSPADLHGAVVCFMK